MNIDFYANGCGTGKTTKIKEIISNTPLAYFLVIVPSKELAKEYADVGEVVISGDVESNTPNVQKRITQATVMDDTRVLIITQAAFINSTDKHHLCKDRIVIQDEELKVFSSERWKMNNHKEWLSMFDVKACAADWFSTNINKSIAEAFLKEVDDLDNPRQVKDLLASPYDVWSNNNKFDEFSQLFKVMKPEVYKSANRVIIACANFKQTFQYQIWKHLYSVNFNCKAEFEGYSGTNTIIHHADQPINSITYNKGDGNVRDAVIKYVTDNAAGDKIIGVDNKRFELPATWVRVDHNCHGVNSHRDTKHIAILSAINYANLESLFLQNICGLSKDAISFALLGETAHQVVMRGVLRMDNTAECHIYVMEQRLAFYLKMALFPDAELLTIAGTARTESAPRKAALTQVDRNKAAHIRKQWPAYANKSAEDIKDELIWDICGSRGRIRPEVLKDYSAEYISAMLNQKEPLIDPFQNR